MSTDISENRSLLEKYSDMTGLRAMLQLIPFGIGSALDSYAGNKSNQIKYNRIKLLLETFSEGVSKLDEEILNKDYIESDEFFILFSKVIGSCEIEKNKEKIEFFKNLLVNTIVTKNIDVDFTHTMTDILKDISYSECLILFEIYRLNNKTKSYQSFSSIDNDLSPYFVTQLRNKGLIDNENQGLTLTTVSRRLIELISENEH